MDFLDLYPSFEDSLRRYGALRRMVSTRLPVDIIIAHVELMLHHRQARLPPYSHASEQIAIHKSC